MSCCINQEEYIFIIPKKDDYSWIDIYSMGVCKSQSHAHPRAALPHIFLDEQCKTLKKAKKISSSIHIYNKIFFHFCICVVLYCLSFEIAAIKKSTHLKALHFQKQSYGVQRLFMTRFASISYILHIFHVWISIRCMDKHRCICLFHFLSFIW